MILHSIASCRATAPARALCVNATSEEGRPELAAAMLPAEAAVRSAASVCRKQLASSLDDNHTASRRAVQGGVEFMNFPFVPF